MNANFTESDISYRSILAAEFSRRRAQDSRYSLRTFARDLGIRASRLSEIFNRKQGMSLSVAEQLANSLQIPESYRTIFKQMVLAEHARSELQRTLESRRLGQLLEGLKSTPEEFERVFGVAYRHGGGSRGDESLIAESIMQLLKGKSNPKLAEACKRIVFQGEPKTLQNLARKILSSLIY